MPHRVTVARYLGDSGVNDAYATPRANIHCRVQGRIELLPDGQRVGTATLFCRLRHGDLFTLDSKVTLDDGTPGYVQAVARHDDGGAGAWQHLEVAIR